MLLIGLVLIASGGWLYITQRRGWWLGALVVLVGIVVSLLAFFAATNLTSGETGG